MKEVRAPFKTAVRADCELSRVTYAFERQCQLTDDFEIYHQVSMHTTTLNLKARCHCKDILKTQGQVLNKIDCGFLTREIMMNIVCSCIASTSTFVYVL